MLRLKLSPKLLSMLCLVSAISLLLVSVPGIVGGQEAAAARTLGAGHAAPKSGLVEGKGSGGATTYIVRLKDAPLASYRGGCPGWRRRARGRPAPESSTCAAPRA